MLVGDVVFQANFEDVDVSPGGYGFFTSVSGLTATGSPVEIQNNHPAVGPASQGVNHLELDGTNGVYVRINNVPAEGLILQGDYSPRRGVSISQNTIDVLWNGQTIATLAEEGRGNQSTEFERFEFTLPSMEGRTWGRLEFRSTSNPDTTVGGLLDDINVYEFESTSNKPPVLQSVNDQTVDEGETVSVKVTATDPDSKPSQLTYSLDRAPVGATIHEVTGQFQWTPNSAAGGLWFPIDVRVTDETGLSDTTTFRINVNDVGSQPPSLVPVSDQSVDEGQQLTVQLSATDPDSPQNQLRYSTTRAPIGSSIDPVTGLFSWTPNKFAGGLRFGIDVEVTDETGLTDSLTFRVDVNDVANIAPQFQSVSDQSMTEGDTISIQLAATDADSPQHLLRYSTTRAPIGSTLDPVTGLFQWTPNRFAGGLRFGIDVVVTDETGLTDQQTFRISVDDMDGSPVLEAISDRSTVELETISVQLMATDPDSAPSQLRYATTRSPIGSTLDPVTGLFQWTPNRYAGGLRFGIDVQVTDETGLSNQKTFRIEVDNLNAAPVLAPIDNQTVEQHSELTFTATATDEDRPHESLTFSLTGSVPDGAQIDPVTGEFRWIPMTDSPEGTYTFNVVVDDGSGNQDFQSIDVQVTSVEDEVQLIEETRFETLAERMIAVNSDTKQLSFEYEALFDIIDVKSINDAFEVALLDDAGNSLVHTIGRNRDAFFNLTEGELPSMGGNTQLDGSTVKLDLSHIAEGTSAKLLFRLVNNDFDNRTEVSVTSIATSDEVLLTPAGAVADSPRRYSEEPIDFDVLSDVTGSVVVGHGETSLNRSDNSLFSKISVTNIGQLSIAGRMIGVFENPSLELARLIRPDGRLPDGRFFIELTPESGILTPGETSHVRDLVISNPTNDRFEFELTVLAGVNTAPSRFITLPPSDVEAGRTVTYNSEAVDPEGQTLEYSIVSGHPDIEIQSDTGQLSWLTKQDDIGSHVVTIRATDPFGLFVEQTFAIQVHETLQNRPPIFITDPVSDAIASSGFEITTVGVGGSPAGVATIGGLQGPRVVTGNAADQTIGVYAGQNNDRFDDAIVYSTGHPRRDGQWVDSGTTVDFGAPEAELVTDFYDISTYDHGDFNGDGYLDIVVGHHFDRANDGSIGTYKISVVLNDGNGMFGAPIDLYENEIYYYQTYVRSILVDDVNADGNADILFAEYHGGGALFVSLGNGDGTFQPISETSFADTIIGDFQVADIDGDGVLDLFGRTFATSGSNRSLFWSRGVGDGTFETPDVFRETRASNFRGTSAPYDLSDLDGDGDLDFVISGDYPFIQVFHNDGIGNFSLVNEITPPNAYAYYGPDWLTIGDFTGDGYDDVLVHHVWQGQLDLLVGDATGVDFTYQDGIDVRSRPDNWAMGFEPIDVDHDGDLDIVFGSEGSKQGVSVGLNDGTGQFLIREYATTDVSTGLKIAYTDVTVRGALFGDYNSDGVMDVSYFTTDNNLSGQTDQHAVGILFGTKPGEFGRTRTEPWAPASFNSVAHFGDFDGDGIVDILDTSRDVTALGNGDGTFGDLVPASGVRRPSTMAAVADYNNDGLDDVVSGLEGGLYVGLSNGDGTFTVNQSISGGGFYGYTTIDPIDLNLDGFMDFVVKEEVGRYFEAYLNDPLNPGTFTMSYTYSLGDGSQGTNVSHWEESWDVGDFTGDGIPDLLTAEREGYSGPQVQIVVFAGDGEGGFNRHSELAGFQEERMGGIYGLAIEPGDFATGDIDNDGDLDLIAHSYLGARVLLNDGTGNFTISHWLDPVRTNQRGRESWVVDFDDDGNLDFVVAVGADISGSFLFWQGDGQGNFEVVEGVNMHGEILGVREPFVDWDNDGRLDLVYNTTDGTSNDIAFYMGRRDDLVDLIAVDLNGDGNEEVITVQQQMERLQIFVGDNLGGLTRQNDLQAGLAPQAVAAADLDGDGQMELLVANRVGRDVTVFTGDLVNGYSQQSFAVNDASSLATRPIDIEAVDVTGDEHPEVFVLDEGNEALWIFEGNGTTTLGVPTAIPLGDRPGRFVIADANGDDQLDVVVTLPDSDRLMILSGIGSHPVNSPIYINLDASPSDVAVLDLNDDGNPDLAATIAESNVLSVHYGLGNNQFARAQEVSVGESPNRVVVTDADEDGRMDLVVTNAGDDTLSVIYNRFDPNEVYRYDSDAIDPDDDPLTYSIVDGPGGLIINSETGQLLWAASPDQVGVHDVTIAADDGRGGVATQSFKVQVEPARENSAPIIATTPVVEIGANEDFTYSVKGLDNDNHPLRYSLLDGPEGAVIHPATGELQWDGRTQAEAYGVRSANGYILVPYHDSLKPESITMEGWFQFSDLTTWPYRREIFAEQGIRSHVLADQTFRTDITLDGETIRLYHDGKAEVGRWLHVAITYDAVTGTATLFLDGHQVDTASFSTPRPLDTTPGTTNVGVGYPTYASIDSYRVWNYARSDSEIAEGLTRHYENEESLVLDFRFEDSSNYRSVRDHSMYGNTGYRVSNGGETQVAPGLAEVGSYTFTVMVEDGRGGTDTQTFTLDVRPELRGSIAGQLFDDLDGDSVQDDGSENPAEPGLEGWHLFIDSNGNGYADPNEHQSTTDADGNYSFEGLLPGEYPVRVSPVAGYVTPAEFSAEVEPEIVREIDPGADNRHDLPIAQLALSQIKGELKTEDGQTIGYWEVYADLNRDGNYNAGEPSAMTDRDGVFAIYGLAAGQYSVQSKRPAGWQESSDPLLVDLGEDEISDGHEITLKPTNTSVTGGVRFITLPSGTVTARDVFRYHSLATSIVPQEIRYDASLAPEGMAVDSATGLVAWRPDVSQVGEHRVILRAIAADGSVALHDFVVLVDAPNTAPIFGSIAPTMGYVGLTFAYDLSAQDAEGESINFSILQGPASASVDASTGQLRWIPEATDVGTAYFEIEARDESGATSTQMFEVAINSDMPSATPFEFADPRASIGLGQTYRSQLIGTDQLGRPLTWTKTDGPGGLEIGQNGEMRWIPGSADLGQNVVEAIATNVDGETESFTFEIEVLGRPVNETPVIVSSPMLSTVLGQLFRYDVVVEDADDNRFDFRLVEAPVGMSIHPVDGSILWNPVEDQLGETDVHIEVTDANGATANQSFKLSVSRAGGPPRITSTPPTEVNVGASYLYSVLATDAEGDPLTFRLLSAPDGATIVESTGEISWTPTVGQIGPQELVVVVSDGVGGAATQAFAVLVGDGIVNLPPTIDSTAPRFTAVGSQYSYQIEATDPESTSLTYTIGQGPVDMTVDSNGLVNWNPADGQVGKFVVTLVVTDAGGASAIESFELDVLAENRAPVISSIAPAVAVVGASFTYDVLVTDADRDRLEFELIQGPTGAEVNAFGQIRWDNGGAALGQYDFEVRVTDPRGGVATQAFIVDLVADTEAPKVSLIETPNDASRNILPWQGPFKVYVRASDNVGVASLTLSANGQDIPLDADGTATFTFEDWTFRAITATATAVDTSGNVTTKSISFDFDIPEGWSGPGGDEIPTAEISSPSDAASVTGMVSIAGTANHADFDIYRLSYRRVDQTKFTEILESHTAVTNGELGVWDTSLLLNDEYVIRLEVATSEGVANVIERNVGLAGELKLGNFQLAFTDMVIPVAGIPIEITRVYDTLQADREGDFGYGWRLEYRDTDLRVGLPKSGLEDIGIYTAFRPGTKVYLNVPGEGRQGFTFDPDIRVLPGFGGENLVLARPGFRPDPGVTSTLSPGVSGYLRVNELGELYAPGNMPYNPASPDFGGAFVLTTRDGITYRVNGTDGKLDSATDRNGNQIELAESGITAEEIGEVVFERDIHGRITSITDFEGHQLSYEYNSAGDLFKSIDREGNETIHVYANDRNHYLLEVIDPLGRVGQKALYDSNGRLRQIVDITGNPTEITYDIDNFLTEIVDPLGNPMLVESDNFGNVVSITDALGNQTRREYSVDGQLTRIELPDGTFVSLSYDSSGNIVQSSEADGVFYRATHDSSGNLLTATDGLGNTTSFTYDSAGNLLSRTAANGDKRSFEYDSKGGLIAETNANGATTGFKLNRQGLPVETIDPLGHSLLAGFDTNGNQLLSSTTKTNAAGQVVNLEHTFNFDANGNEIGATNSVGQSITRTFNANGEIIQQSSTGGLVVDFDDAVLGTPATVSAAGNDVIAREFDELGRVNKEIASNGRYEVYNYDAAGRIVSRTNYIEGVSEPLAEIRFEYDTAGRVSASMDANGNRTEYEYDQSGNRALVRNALGQLEHYHYDANDRLVEVVDRRNQSTKFHYDENGNRVGVVYPNARLEFRYDGVGNLIESIDELGAATRYEYDQKNLLVAVIDPLGNRTEYERDEVGNVIRVTDALGRVTSFEYDNLSRLIATIRPEGHRSETEFNAEGDILAYTDYRGQTDVYSHNAELGWTTQVDYGSDMVQYEYDDFGQLKSIVDVIGTTSFTYDESGRIASKTDANGNQIAYRYDSVGNVIEIQTPDGLIAQRYDALNRLVEIVDQDGEVTSLAYDANDNLIRKEFGNGAVEVMTYDQRDMVISKTTYSDLGVLIYQSDIERDLNGNVSGVVLMDGSSMSYEYDQKLQLVLEKITDRDGTTTTIQYSYDSVGNRIRKVDSRTGITHYEYDANDRLVASTGAENATYRYDANGSLVEKIEDGRVTTFTWDNRDQLVEVQIADETTIHYGYDDNGLRIFSNVNGDTTEFVFDANREYAQVLVEFDAQQESTNYVYADDIPISQKSTGSTSYLHDNFIGTITHTTDEAGELGGAGVYSAFGDLISSDSGFNSKIGFAGEYYDADVGLGYHRARFLDVANARFVSTDAYFGDFENPTSLHRYLYAANSPTIFSDPSGDMTLSEKIQVVGMVGGLAGIGLAVVTGAIGFRDSVTWSGGSGAVTADPKFFNKAVGAPNGALSEGSKLGKIDVGLSIGLQLNVFETKNGLNTQTDNWDGHYYGFSTTLISSISFGKSSGLPVGLSVGTFEVKVNQMFYGKANRYFQSLTIAGPYFLMDGSFAIGPVGTTGAGDIPGSFLQMGLGQGNADGIGFNLGNASSAGLTFTGGFTFFGLDTSLKGFLGY